MRRTLLLIAACAVASSPAMAEPKNGPPIAVLEIGLAVGPWWTDTPSESGVFIGGLFGVRFFKRYGKPRGEKWDTRLTLEYGGRVTFGGNIANNGESAATGGVPETNGGFAFTAVPTVQVWSRWQGIGVFARYASETIPSGVLRDANGLADFKNQVTTGGPLVSVGIHHWDQPGVVVASFRWEPLPDMRLDRFAVELHTSLYAWFFVEYRRFGAEASDGIVRGGQLLLFSFGLSPTGIATIKPKPRR